MKGKSELFDLEKHLAFYGAYHSNTVNKLIHIFSVWPMFFAFLVLFYFVPPVYDLSDKMIFFSSGLVLNFGLLFAMIHALLYICLDKKAGSLAALLCFACWIGACALASKLSFSVAWKAVLAFQLFCFSTQALGHAIWEIVTTYNQFYTVAKLIVKKRAPAEDLVLAIAMAPFCVFLEVLHTVFGYEPYPGFHASVQAKIEVEIKNWQSKNQKKIS